jgi:hypothetical protein
MIQRNLVRLDVSRIECHRGLDNPLVASRNWRLSGVVYFDQAYHQGAK